MFAPEGTRLLVAAALTGAVLAIVGLLVGEWGWALVVLGALVLAVPLWMLRDPLRTPPPGSDLFLLAPADGVVAEIVEAREPLYLQGPARRVSIAPSLLDVRVHRSPATGTVEHARTVPGEPERREVGLRHPSGVPVLVTQIGAGVAGGLVSDVATGRRVSAGERLGVALFGARVEIAVPPQIVLDVEVGQRTVAGETVIGRLPTSEASPNGRALKPEPIAEVV